MNAANPLPIALHEDVAFLGKALRFTAAETGFISRLIEKDYFCTLVLQYLCESDVTLIFKGGTCLAKVHAGFYRLSEDLDFSISMSTEIGALDSRSGRKRLQSRGRSNTHKDAPVLRERGRMAAAHHSRHSAGAHAVA